MGIKWYYDNPVNDVIIFYDRHLRMWTVYPVDADGNQLCEAEYTTNKKRTEEIAEYFKRESL